MSKKLASFPFFYRPVNLLGVAGWAARTPGLFTKTRWPPARYGRLKSMPVLMRKLLSRTSYSAKSPRAFGIINSLPVGRGVRRPGELDQRFETLSFIANGRSDPAFLLYNTLVWARQDGRLWITTRRITDVNDIASKLNFNCKNRATGLLTGVDVTDMLLNFGTLFGRGGWVLESVQVTCDFEAWCELPEGGST